MGTTVKKDSFEHFYRGGKEVYQTHLLNIPFIDSTLLLNIPFIDSTLNKKKTANILMIFSENTNALNIV